MTDIIEPIAEVPLADQTEARGLGCTVSNVREVFAIGAGEWACRVDLTFDDGSVETVDYVARVDDAMHTGQWVVARIQAGYGGTVGTAAEYEAWKASREAADWTAKADADRKAELRAEAARVRWERETGGVVWSGHDVSTDRESQGKVTALYTLAVGGLVTAANWKFSDGFATLSAAEIQALGLAIAAHVQGAFDAEAQAVAAIEAGQITTKADVASAILGTSNE